MLSYCVVYLVLVCLVVENVAFESSSKAMCTKTFTRSAQSTSCNKCDWYGNLSHSLSLHIEDNTVLMFCSDKTVLSDLIHIANKTNVSLLGLANTSTVIHCRKSGNGSPGLRFTNIIQLQISNISLLGCGALHDGLTFTVNSTTTIPFLASIYIYNSTDIHIQYVNIEDGNGTGLAIIDTVGFVKVAYSNFKNNSIKANSSLSEGGGVYVDFTYCPPGIVSECEAFPRNNKNSTYLFSHNTFVANKASVVTKSHNTAPLRYHAQKTNFQRVGRGGGISLYFRADASSNSITVEHCSFLANNATLGGGLFITFHDTPRNNLVVVRNCDFTRNVAKNGGGGIDAGFLFFNNRLTLRPVGNEVTFEHCNMTSNIAKYGGGTKLFSTKSIFNRLNNSIIFVKCLWQQNKAQFGSAVEISPHVWNTIAAGYLPNLEFKDCKFSSNFRQDVTVREGIYANYTWGKGILLTTVFPIHFSGNTSFNSNNSSALYASSSSIEFAAGSMVEFNHNRGYRGGAVALIGFSALHVRDNSTFLFINNTAISKGGAIVYQSNNRLDFVSSRSCFIQYVGDTKLVEERAINFYFQGNKAGRMTETYGQTIYATTILPCQRGCFTRENRISLHGLDCIGNLTFINQKKHEVSTSGARFDVQRSYTQQPVSVIPGRETELKFQILDDLNSETFDSYHVLLVQSSSNKGSVRLDPTYSYITDKKVRLYGNAGDRVHIQLGTTGFREITISFEIKMEQCPPGYVTQMNSEQKGSECICSASTMNKTYVGIDWCNQNEFKAYMKRGYWFGYDGTETEENLQSGYCPRGFCFGKESEVSERLKPTNVSLRQFVCSDFRQGKLCGSCVDNHSHFFHSDNYNCFANKNCSVGLLLYIVSELVPVSILFMIVIFFNVKLTSGSVNGFIFFIQFIDTMLIDANGFIPIHPIIDVLMTSYQFIYRMFNLNFFTLDHISFCLWEGANTLDILAFKYVTIVYSLLLVMATVLLMKVCNITQLKKNVLFKLTSSHDLMKGTVIHGFSAFFVMCYSQCAKVTLFLLTPARIYSIGSPHKQNVTKVVFYSGDYLFLHNNHLKYALPALLFAVTLVLIPPTLLLIYPLCYRLFAFFQMEETQCLQILCKVIPLEKMKPLFDSFQSCFKDKYRFFAGLYFLYRLVALISFLVTDSLTKFYIALEVQLILMLTLQATTYAYKKYWHNILDTLLFADLAIINAMTMYNYRTKKNADPLTINIISGVQTFLVLLPIVYMLCLVCAQIVWKLKSQKSKKQKQDDLTDTLSLLEYRQYT